MKNKVAYFGVLLALALIFSYVETLIPINFGIPGVKLGLANLIIVVGLNKISTSELYLLDILRVLISGFIFANGFAIIYSLTGAIISLTVMVLLNRIKGFSLLGISAAGGVFHNIGQLIVAIFVVNTLSISYYFPILLISGLVTGIVIGIVTNEVNKRLKIPEM
ncbi:MAG: Gx transporter family protein [Lachnospiraceae bacterium]|nr:Gx transporter family protein [Lachnospiraceae bacterium]